MDTVMPSEGFESSQAHHIQTLRPDSAMPGPGFFVGFGPGHQAVLTATSAQA